MPRISGVHEQVSEVLQTFRVGEPRHARFELVDQERYDPVGTVLLLDGRPGMVQTRQKIPIVYDVARRSARILNHQSMDGAKEISRRARYNRLHVEHSRQESVGVDGLLVQILFELQQEGRFAASPSAE